MLLLKKIAFILSGSIINVSNVLCSFSPTKRAGAICPTKAIDTVVEKIKKLLINTIGTITPPITSIITKKAIFALFT
jgi:hypothetical protein